jgi:hypothetical protein
MQLPIAHIAGVPVEELLLPIVYGAGAVWGAARAFTSEPAKRARARLRQHKTDPHALSRNPR